MIVGNVILDLINLMASQLTGIATQKKIEKNDIMHIYKLFSEQ